MSQPRGRRSLRIGKEGDLTLDATTQTLEPFVKQCAVLLTTYKRDSTPVGTAVNIAVDGDHAYFRTWDTAWKLKRIRNDPEVEFVPCTPLGRPKGGPVRARARILGGKESTHASHLLARKYPVMHGIMVPLVHRLRKNTTMHVELKPTDGETGIRDRNLSNAKRTWPKRAGTVIGQKPKAEG